jgi:hypothetical protein
MELIFMSIVTEKQSSNYDLLTITPASFTATVPESTQRAWSPRRELFFLLPSAILESMAAWRLRIRMLTAICFGGRDACNLALDAWMVWRERDGEA